MREHKAFQSGLWVEFVFLFPPLHSAKLLYEALFQSRIMHDDDNDFKHRVTTAAAVENQKFMRAFKVLPRIAWSQFPNFHFPARAFSERSFAQVMSVCWFLIQLGRVRCGEFECDITCTWRSNLTYFVTLIKNPELETGRQAYFTQQQQAGKLINVIHSSKKLRHFNLSLLEGRTHKITI